ncbi:protein kinase, partial [Catenulispora sp. NF23]
GGRSAGGGSAGDGNGDGGGGDQHGEGGSRGATGSGGAALIAPVVAADPEAELPWLASEYVPGPSITDALLDFGPFSPAGLHTLTHGLALALAEVHAAGVVHRDVKPSNVLVAPDGPRLIDFGVARAVDDVPLTRAGALIGSPGFLSPEQAVGEPTSFASDVFAMATVVAYAARGQSPFGAGDGPALLYRVVHEPPKLDGLPDDLVEILTACLAKDPAERPSAPEIADRVAPAADWLSQAVLGDIARREAELAAWLEVTAADPLWVPTTSAAQTTAFDSVADSALDIANAVAAQPSHIGARRRRPRNAESRPQTEVRTEARTEAQSALSQAASYELRRPTPPLGSPADGIREPGLARGSAEQPAASGTPPQAEPARTPPELPHYSPKQPDITDAEHHRPGPGSAYTAVLLDPESEPSAAEPSKPSTTEPPDIPPLTTQHRAPRRRFPIYAALGAFLGGAVAATLLLLPHTGHSAPPRPLSPATSVSTASTASTAKPRAKPKAASPSPSSGGRSGRESTPRTTSASESRR